MTNLLEEMLTTELAEIKKRYVELDARKGQLTREVIRLRRENEDLTRILEKIMSEDGAHISSESYFETQELLRRIGVKKPPEPLTY